MMYRPQYGFAPTPPGFEDETFVYSFDNTNTPLLGVNLLAGQQANNIILLTQPDAQFVARAISITLLGLENNLQIQLKDPWGNYLEDTYLLSTRGYKGSGAQIVGRTPVSLEPEILCPPGGFFTAYLNNSTLGTLTPPSITLFGVKRRRLEGVAA